MSNKKWLWCVAAALPALTTLGCASNCPEASPALQREGFVRSLPDTQEPARLLSKEDTVGMRSGLMILQPGKDCGWHSTENYEEMIICLAGAGELRSEAGPPQSLAAGQYGYNPPHTRHNVFNTGTEAMRYVYVVAPAMATDGHH